jgi:hypothetical protein
LSPLRKKKLPKSGKKRAAALERERSLIEQRRREVQAETAALVATTGAQTEQEIANSDLSGLKMLKPDDLTSK